MLSFIKVVLRTILRTHPKSILQTWCRMFGTPSVREVGKRIGLLRHRQKVVFPARRTVQQTRLANYRTDFQGLGAGHTLPLSSG